MSMFDETLLHQEPLTKMINDYKPENTPLVNLGLFSKDTTEGQQYQLDIVKTNRNKAGAVGRHAPSTTVKPEILKRQSISLARTSENVGLKGSTLINLRNPGSLSLNGAAAKRVAMEVKKLGGRIDRRNEFYMAQAIQGSITDKIEGVSFTIDFLFASDHKLTIGGNQIAVSGGAFAFATGWDDPDADVISDITALKQKAQEDSGYELKTAVVSPEVIANLMKNNQVNTYFRSTPDGVAMLKEGSMGHFMGLDWLSYGATFKDDQNSDTITRYLAKGKACFLPGSDPEVAQFITGDDYIANQAKTDMITVNGRYAFSQITEDPAGIKLVAGEVSMPVIYNPGAFFLATLF